MRIFLSSSLLVLLASAASAQFATRVPGANAPPAGAPVPDAGAKPGDPATAHGGGGALFAVLDLDGDGTISKAELRKALVSLKKLDTDKDGALTLAECGGGAGPVADAAGGAGVAGAGANGQDPLVERLMASDKNGDGRLTPEELSPNERQMLQGADLNEDGAIDRQELAARGAVLSALQGGPGGPGGFNRSGQGGGAGRNGGNEAMGRFFQYDRNGDGRLTPDEVPPQAQAMMGQADLNRDGTIDAGEMQQALARLGDRAKAWAGGANPNAAPNNNPGNDGTGDPKEPRNRRRPREEKP
ncbi:MAG: hypothetical protein IT425_11640 [Pirellulales bacterium]|nr:hypothetical protein [Pirellulales bacterium]